MTLDQSSASFERLSASEGTILRDVELHAQPIKLTRVGRGPSGLAERPEPVSPLLVAAVSAGDEMPDIEQQLIEAREAAYAAGHQAAMDALDEKQARASREIQRDARKSGYEAGHQEGMDAAKADAATLLQASEAALRAEWTEKMKHLEDMVRQVAEQIPVLVGEAEEEMVSLVFEAVGGVLGEALATSQGIRSFVKSLVAKHTSRAQISVHLHPRDWIMVTEALPAEPDGTPAVKWISDPEVTSGGVVLHHGRGRLDASLDTVMRNLRATLLRVREDRAHSATMATVPAASSAAAGNKSAV